MNSKLNAWFQASVVALGFVTMLVVFGDEPSFDLDWFVARVLLPCGLAALTWVQVRYRVPLGQHCLHLLAFMAAWVAVLAAIRPFPTYKFLALLP